MPKNYLAGLSEALESAELTPAQAKYLAWARGEAPTPTGQLVEKGAREPDHWKGMPHTSVMSSISWRPGEGWTRLTEEEPKNYLAGLSEALESAELTPAQAKYLAWARGEAPTPTGQLVEAPPPDERDNILELLAKSLGSGTADVAEMGGAGVSAIGRGLLHPVEWSRLPPGIPLIKVHGRSKEPVAEWVGKAGSSLEETGATFRESMKEVKRKLAPAHEYSTFEEILAGAARSIPQLIGTLGATFFASPVAGLAFAGGMEGYHAYQRAIAEGASEEDAMVIAIETGIANGILEYLPVGRVAKIFKRSVKETTKKLKRMIEGALKGGFAEGGTEVAQEIASEIIFVVTLAKDGEITAKQLWEALTNPEMRHSYVVSFGAGFTVGAPLRGAAEALAPQAPPSLLGTEEPPHERRDFIQRALERRDRQELEGGIHRAPQKPFPDLPTSPTNPMPIGDLPLYPQEPEPTPEPEPEPEPTPARPPLEFQPGKAGTAVVPATNEEFEYEWAIVDIDDMIVSHVDVGAERTVDLRINPDYPADRQLRDRARAASSRQVQDIAKNIDPARLGANRSGTQGSPVIELDRTVLSGNARTEAVRRHYRNAEKYGEGLVPVDPDKAVFLPAYKDWLQKNAKEFDRGDGVLIENARSIQRPLLVRVLRSDLDRAGLNQLARDLNVPDVATMSEPEMAASDATQITPEMLEGLSPDSASGEINMANSGDFIRSFSREIVRESQRGDFMAGKGELSQAGARRVRNAVLARTYKDPEAIARIVESTDDNTRRIGQGMLVAAPRMVRIRQGVELGRLHELDIGEDISEAAALVSLLRRTGERPVDFFSQMALAESQLSKPAEAIAKVLTGHTDPQNISRSAKRIGLFFQRYADLVEARPKQQEGLFGKDEPPTKVELIEEAALTYEVAAGGQQEGLFGEKGEVLTDEVAPSKVLSRASVRTAGRTDPVDYERLARMLQRGSTTEGPLGTPVAGREKAKPLEPEFGRPGEEGYPISESEMEVGEGGRIITTRPRDIVGEEEVSGLDLPELVDLARKIGEGKLPKVKRLLQGSPGVSGFFDPQSRRPGEGREYIALKADIFKNPLEAARTLAHEIGHWIDFIPEGYISGRGNILGRLASLKNYARRTIDKFPEDVTKALGRETLDRFRRKAEKAYPEDEDQRRGAYHAMVENEISERGLITAKELWKELWAVSIWWRPMMQTVNGVQIDGWTQPKYVRYRGQGPEIIADVISALLNNPEGLRSRAPLFFESFMGERGGEGREGYIVRKPVLKEAWDAVQDLHRQGGKARRDVRLGRYRKMMRKGRERLGAAQLAKRAKKEAADIGFLDDLLEGLIDQTHRIRKTRKRLAKEGALLSKRNPLYGLEEMSYASSASYAYIHRVVEVLLDPAKEAGLADEDIGVWLGLRRAAGERGDMANPLGEQGPFAAELRAHQAEELGPEQTKELTGWLREWWLIRKGMILEPAISSGIVTEENGEKFLRNSGYATFKVQSYIDEGVMQGDGNLGMMKRQWGTLEEIGDPLLQTILTDLSLLYISHRNRVASDLVELYRAAGQAEDAKRAKGGRIIETKEVGMKTVYYLVNGKKVGVHMPEEVSRALDHQIQTGPVINFFTKFFHRPLANLLVVHNPGWWVWNLQRDVRAFAMNVVRVEQGLPPIEMKEGVAGAWQWVGTYAKTGLSPARSLAIAMKYVYQSAPDAARIVWKGQLPDDFLEMLEQRMVFPPGKKHRPTKRSMMDSEDALAQVFEDFGFPLASTKDVSDVRRALNTLKPLAFLFSSKPGEWSEKAVKLAGYRYLKDNQQRMGLSDQKIANMVRTMVGTPDVMRRGRWHAITNNLFIFSGVAKEGYRSGWQAFKEHPGEYAWKQIATAVVAPKVFLWAADQGLMGEEMKECVNKISEQDKRRYLIIPWGCTEDGVAVYTRLPQDHIGQVIGEMTWAMMDRDPKAATKTFFEALPWGWGSQLHPVIEVGLGAADIVQDVPPMDKWRGYPVHSREIWESGDSAAIWLEFGKWAADNLGTRSIISFRNIEDAKSTLEKVARAWPGADTLFRRFVSFSSERHPADLMELRARQTKEGAQLSRARKKMIDKHMREGVGLGTAWREMQEAGIGYANRSTLERARTNWRLAKEGDPYAIAIGRAPSKKAEAEIRALQEKE